MLSASSRAPPSHLFASSRQAAGTLSGSAWRLAAARHRWPSTPDGLATMAADPAHEGRLGQALAVRHSEDELAGPDDPLGEFVPKTERDLAARPLP